jgi:hypothetical protein
MLNIIKTKIIFLNCSTDQNGGGYMQYREEMCPVGNTEITEDYGEKTDV